MSDVTISIAVRDIINLDHVSRSDKILDLF